MVSDHEDSSAWRELNSFWDHMYAPEWTHVYSNKAALNL